VLIYVITVYTEIARSPNLHCGRSSPPLPIAIQCWSLAEARIVIAQLQPILDQAPRNLLTRDLLSLFGKSKKVRKIFNEHSKNFFPVVVGQRVGIHRTRCNIQPSHANFVLMLSQAISLTLARQLHVSAVERSAHFLAGTCLYDCKGSGGASGECSQV